MPVGRMGMGKVAGLIWEKGVKADLRAGIKT